MKFFLFFFLSVLLCGVQGFSETKCFLLSEKGYILKQEGNCKERHAPCSTFKIPISLMGYNDGILIDAVTPEWPFKQRYADWYEIWKRPQNPTSWIKNTCVWYSQLITQKIGLRKFKAYLAQFDYGNQDVSGDKGKNNGLTESWLSSSLKISGLEQLAFLEKLLNDKLPVSAKAQRLTRHLLFVEDLAPGWKLYEKTGSGRVPKPDGSQGDLKMGWFIGWIQKGDRKVLFVHYIEDDKKMEDSGGSRAKEIAKKKLLEFVQSTE
ncbi:MAG: class D beta-lactamase [Alphaproteobacteria bacterium RIFCSPLOWO2_01_FULL_45_8]|nr:MAG: class D beta-lactamase [Alphaproteobacteria bacterium GWA1_45_9]OFW89910.1 MAG: class D beta-lactamase [Alphaproteobacteria bacterium RIFCSPHIGHO2_01_FULL_41_14]OFW96019.1 MAG: class D beta-lactamase [Alphaproteobacteria bacterium RIFCSPLOWO2_01_FULL_45_8]HCI48347.1 class D beta-lactamase [Holosporales bacterium]